MGSNRTSKRNTGKRCCHCKAPEKSVFEETPLLLKYEEKHYTLETNEYNIQHFYDQEKKLAKEWKPKTVQKDSMKTVSMFSRISDNPLNQTWSGYTFMTEHENERIERAYQEDLAGSKVDRVVWRKFDKKLKTEQVQQRSIVAGPEWFQDLSPQQMELVDHLEVALQSDRKENHSGRAQQFLYDLGIWPEVPPKLVAKCVKNSGADVINFLFLVHKTVVDIETPEYEKKFAEAKKQKIPISPYSINERILLTSVFHYHFPTMLKKLDQLLPPPYQEPTVLWGKKPPKRKKIYSSPYLEPLPINDKPWYEERAEEELERKVLRRIKREKERKERQELMEKMKQQEAMLKQKKEEKKMKPKEEQRTSFVPGSFTMSIFDDDDVVNMAALPPRERKSNFFQKFSKRISDYIESHFNELQESLIDDDDEPPVKENQPPPSNEVGKKEEVTNVKSPEADLKRSSSQDSFLSESEMVVKLPTNLSMTEDVAPMIGTEVETGIQNSSPEEEDVRYSDQFGKTSLISGLFGSFNGGTRCLLDTELEDISEDIRMIKAPSVNSPKTSSEETVEEFKPKNFWVPLDITYKELTSVSRISSRSQLEKEQLSACRKMSGPPLPDLSVLKNVIRVSRKMSASKNSFNAKPRTSFQKVLSNSNK